MTVDPEALAKVTYSASRPTQSDCCPPWEELPQEQIDAMIASTRDAIAILHDNGYDIVKSNH